MTTPRAAYKGTKEADWQDTVVQHLRLNWWRVAHWRTSMNARGVHLTAVQYDAKGFPDLICVHPATGDFFVAELKREYGSATPEQLQWLAWWEACGVNAYLWKPSDIDAVIARVTKPRRV